MNDPVGRRLWVVGTSGSGKTTTARELAALLGYPHYEMDALFWGPDWTPVERDEMRRRVSEIVQRPLWVIDGNYSVATDLVQSRADTIVWLDYPRKVVMGQLLRRTMVRAVKREELWSGNRESLSKSFLSTDSILLWAWQTYNIRRRRYESMMDDPAANHIRFIRLQTPAESKTWLSGMRITNSGYRT